MAYVETRFPAPDYMNLNVWINLDAAVGPHDPNRANDVVTVQGFLNGIFANDPAYPNGVPVTGRFDALTGRAIRDFQRRWRRMARAAAGVRDGAIDGRVSPARGVGYQRGAAVWTYTIIDLNIEYREYDPQGYADLLALNGHSPSGVAGTTATPGAEAASTGH